MCQEMPTGLYTRWEIDAETKKFIPIQNRRRRFENMVMDHLQNTRPECRIQSNYTTGNQHKIDNFSVDGFVDTVKLCLKLWDVSMMAVSVKWQRKKLMLILSNFDKNGESLTQNEKIL